MVARIIAVIACPSVRPSVCYKSELSVNNTCDGQPAVAKFLYVQSLEENVSGEYSYCGNTR